MELVLAVLCPNHQLLSPSPFPSSGCQKSPAPSLKGPVEDLPRFSSEQLFLGRFQNKCPRVTLETSIQRSSRQLLLQEEHEASLPYTQLPERLLFFHKDLPQAQLDGTFRVSWLWLPQAEGSSGMEWNTLSIIQTGAKPAQFPHSYFKIAVSGRGECQVGGTRVSGRESGSFFPTGHAAPR